MKSLYFNNPTFQKKKSARIYEIILLSVLYNTEQIPFMISVINPQTANFSIPIDIKMNEISGRFR